MKKTIFTAFALGAMVLTGCTKVETVDVPESRAIAFDNFVTNSVKSLNTEGTDFTSFFVYGGFEGEYKLFDNREVKYEEVNGTPGWYYQDNEYWMDGQTYNFAAYSYENGTISNISWNTAYTHLIIPVENVDGTKDLIYAYESNLEGPGTVTFDFHHILSRVTFKFTKDATLNGTDILISDLKITSVNNSGKFEGKDLTDGQYLYDVWTGQTGTYSQSFENSGSMSLTDDALVLTTDYEYLIPQSAGADVLEVTFTLTPSGKITEAPYNKTEAINCKVQLPATTDNKWNPGYTYVYTATITPGNFDLKPIVFDVNVINNWEDNIDVDFQDDIQVE